MQKWEFHFEMITVMTDMKSPERSAVYSKVRGLGQHGWELVSVFVSRGDVWAAFKRPVQDKPEAGAKSAGEGLKRSAQREPR